jgi:hypothetical protein
MIYSDPAYFIIFEFIYLCLILLFIFTNVKIFSYCAYFLAAVKFPISSLNSIDIFNYTSVYNDAESSSFFSHNSMEIGFLSLIYIAHNLNISLALVHGLLIIFFLFSINYLLSTFLNNEKIVNSIVLIFGFYSAGGELCSYLLRQLISTSLVFIGIGLLLRKRKYLSWFIYSFSFLFHSSSIFYIPIFIALLFSKAYIRILILILGYSLMSLTLLIPQFTSAIILLGGDSSLYYSKFESYTSKEEGFKEEGFGILTLGLLVYFFSVLTLRLKSIINSDYILNRFNQYFCYCFTVLITLLYLILNLSRVFWLSSRIYFISNFFLLISSIFLTFEILGFNYRKYITSFIAIILFISSSIFIINNYIVNDIYKLPF